LPGLGLSALLLFAAPTDTSAPAAAVHAEARTITRVWLLAPTLDQEALAGAVSARLADKQILGAGQAAGPSDGLAALCRVSSPTPDQLQLEVILSDGRLYQRTITAPAEARERAAARLIASTLAAIEDASATPERRDGIFAPPTIVPPNPSIVATPEIAPALSSPDEQPINPAPDPSSPPVEPPPDPANDLSSRPDGPPHRQPLELGVALELGPGFGLGTPAAGLGLAAGGSGLRIDLRLRRGLTLAAGFRGHARRSDGLALGRFRWALGVGYTLRHRSLELALLAGPSLETWQVTQRGAPVAYASNSSSGASLLFGGLARAALGGRLQARRMSARLGVYLEFAASARSSGRAAQIVRTEPQGAQTPVFVLGGSELSAGLEVELWFALRGRR
jgi:hypothetical protein